MIDVFRLKSGKRLLLVGEGNFSFTVSLLNKLAVESPSCLSPTKVISTCFQKFRELSDLIKENAKLACKLGAEIWFGVDATSLHHHERLKSETFDCIIFNFPHVGGKMKLHLNRLLLRNFFKSASFLLSVNGQVLVTLCQGQSGTPYDTIKRKKGDTWQIIDMASFADLILMKVHPFCSADWPLYNSNGYRGLEKGFHVNGAYTFAFHKVPLIVEIKTIKQEEFNNVHCPYVQKLLDQQKNGVFQEVHLFSHLLKAKPKTLKVCNTVQTICLCLHKEADGIDWWELDMKENHYDICCFLLCYPCCMGNVEPVRKVIMINATREYTVSLLNFLDFRCTRRLEGKLNEHCASIFHYEETDNDLKVATIFEKNSKENMTQVAIYVDAFIRLTTNFCVPQLPFRLNLSGVVVSSLHPPAHCHHLCFWISDDFSASHFACSLRYAAGDIIRSFQLIDEYYCPVKKQKSLCYQITYQSFHGALSSEKAFFLQTKVIGPFLEECLDVTIR